MLSRTPSRGKIAKNERIRQRLPGARVTLVLVTLAGFGMGCSGFGFDIPWPWKKGRSEEIMFEDVGPADELYAEGMKILDGERKFGIIPMVDYDRAIETFQAIIDNYPYSDYAVQAELRIADAYFDDKRYEEALSYYRSFADIHPQHEQVPYTILQAALCHFKQISTVDRDQTSTLEAQLYLEKLIRQYPYAPETREAETLLRKLRTQLSRNIMQMGDFYLKRKEYQAAAERYRSLLNTYPGLGMDAEGLYKLGVCYENMMREDEALRLFHVVVANYPGTDLAQRAAGHIANAN